MKAVIYLDVPDWQIGQDVSVYFPDTMMKHGKCELLKEQEHKDRMYYALEDDWKRLKELLKEHEAEISKISNAYLELVGKASKQPKVVLCKDCKHRDPEDKKCDCGHDIHWQLPRQDDWFCADGEKRE